MTPEDILELLTSSGFSIVAENGTLIIRPASLPETLQTTIRSMKADLVRLLSDPNNPTTNTFGTEPPRDTPEIPPQDYQIQPFQNQAEALNSTIAEARYIVQTLKAKPRHSAGANPDLALDIRRLDTLLTRATADGATNIDTLALMVATVDIFTRRIDPTWRDTIPGSQSRHNPTRPSPARPSPS